MNDINISQIIKKYNKGVSCYWMNIFHIMSLFCAGNCEGNYSLYGHNQSLVFIVVIVVSSESVLEIMTICDAFFGDINATLSDISSMIESITKIVFNIYQISDIIRGPDSDSYLLRKQIKIISPARGEGRGESCF